MRPLRFIPPHSIVEVSIRTVHGRLLLRPGRPTNEAILGILGQAQARHGMVVHYVVVMSNHIHLLLCPRDAHQLARFMCFVNSNVAREVGRIVGWRERFWSGRYHAIVVSDEAEAQLGRLRYLLSQAVKEGLVAHPFEWPGVSSARALAEGDQLAGTWIDRVGLYRARQRSKPDDPPIDAADFTTVIPVEIEPLPCLGHLAVDAQRRWVRELIAEIAASAAALTAELRRGVLGVKAILRRHPHSAPEVSHSPAPLFHAFRVEVKRRLREAYGVFVAAYREAAARVRSGLDLKIAAFPEGCFPPTGAFIGHPRRCFQVPGTWG
jgi:REP element-mobilizing transposase RayT